MKNVGKQTPSDLFVWLKERLMFHVIYSCVTRLFRFRSRSDSIRLGVKSTGLRSSVLVMSEILGHQTIFGPVLA